jgi:hypothetical protein
LSAGICGQDDEKENVFDRYCSLIAIKSIFLQAFEPTALRAFARAHSLSFLQNVTSPYEGSGVLSATHSQLSLFVVCMEEGSGKVTVVQRSESV